jgi:hypothetical protein
MSRFFFVAIAFGLMALLALLLSLLLFHTVDAPISRLAMPGTFAVPLGFFF